jgi:hypothetical protein
VRTTADGRLTSFTSWATNLGPVVTNGNANAFVIDNFTGVVELVDLGAQGQQPDASVDSSPDLSDDGRFVVFV